MHPNVTSALKYKNPPENRFCVETMYINSHVQQMKKYTKYHKSVSYVYKSCIHDLQTVVLISPSRASSGKLRLKCNWVRVAVQVMLYEENIATECTDGKNHPHFSALIILLETTYYL